MVISKVMNRRACAWTIALAVFALAAILGAYDFPDRWLHYVSKPLATACALAIALLHRAAAPRYRMAIAAGLVFSLLGDVLLMLPWNLFAAGLGAFLAAHIAYLVAFTDRVRFGKRLLPFALYGLVAALLTAVLWPGVPPELRPAVLAYTSVLAAMAAQAWARARVLDTQAARLAAFGAGVFVLSDMSLALDRFRFPSVAGEVLVLGTYWVAQGMIAWSVILSGSRRDSVHAASSVPGVTSTNAKIQ